MRRTNNRKINLAMKVQDPEDKQKLLINAVMYEHYQELFLV